jgi:hypothetical protein
MGRQVAATVDAYRVHRRLDGEARVWARACNGVAALPRAVAGRDWAAVASALTALGVAQGEAARAVERLRGLHRRHRPAA